MVKLRLAFGKLLVNHPPEDSDLLSMVEAALVEAPVRSAGRRSNATAAFIDVARRQVGGRAYLTASYAFARGEQYQIIDMEQKTISEASYPVQPYQGQAFFVLDQEGHLVIEARSESVISPQNLTNAIRSEVNRSLGFRESVVVELLGLEESHESMAKFIKSLRALKVIEFSELRHSNPSERSRYMDAAADQRVQDIIHKTEHEAGIDREHPEFEAELEHAKRYAKINHAGGIADDGWQSMTMDGEELRLTVDAESREDDDKLKKMVSVFHQIFESLRRLV